MIQQLLPILYKFIMFGIIGCISMVLDFALTYLIKEKFKWNKYVANSISFCFVGFINFNLNRHFTFTDHTANYNIQLLKFFAVSSTGLVLNNLITYYFTEKREYNFYFSKLLATVIVIFWNFTMNKVFTFKS
jgi:putative flippase GtrA